MLCKRSHCNGKPVCSNEDTRQPKIVNKNLKKKKKDNGFESQSELHSFNRTYWRGDMITMGSINWVLTLPWIDIRHSVI